MGEKPVVEILSAVHPRPAIVPEILVDGHPDVPACLIQCVGGFERPLGKHEVVASSLEQLYRQLADLVHLSCEELVQQRAHRGRVIGGHRVHAHIDQPGIVWVPPPGLYRQPRLVGLFHGLRGDIGPHRA